MCSPLYSLSQTHTHTHTHTQSLLRPPLTIKQNNHSSLCFETPFKGGTNKFYLFFIFPPPHLSSSVALSCPLLQEPVHMFCSQMRGFSLLWLLIYEEKKKKKSRSLRRADADTPGPFFFHMHSQSQGIQLMCHRLTIFIAQFEELQYDLAVFWVVFVFFFL